MSQRHTATADDTITIATRLLSMIRADLLELEPGFDLDDDLFAAGLDSMAIMQVIVMLEDEFGVKLPDASIKRTTFGTARSIAETVRGLRNQL